MKNLDRPVINIIDLNQVCMVVNDLEKSMASLWRTFGIGPWNIYIRDHHSKVEGEMIWDMTYYGKPARYSYNVAMTQDKLGGVFIELIQPVDGDNIYQDFLNRQGEGVQHLGWHIVESQEAFAETWKRLEEEGFACMMSARLYNTAVAYFDTTKVLGTILEVVWRDPDKIRPAPARVFPGP